MRCIGIFLVFVAIARSVRKYSTLPTNVWPGSSAGFDLSGMYAVNAPVPVEVWSIEKAYRKMHETKTDQSPWTQCDGDSCVCDGYLRFGSAKNQVYSPPIVANNAALQCDIDSVRSFLWNSDTSIGSSCQCRHLSSLNIVLRGRCLSQGLGGWIGPGLVSCTDPAAINLITEWKYHPVSGQIRTTTLNATTAFGTSPGGMCVSAVPYSTKLGENFSSNWNAWSIKLLPCLSDVNPYNRQAWDLPPGVGDSYKVSMESIFGGSANALGPSVGTEPSGSPGRVRLRDSSDIGGRCLEIAVNPPNIPTTIAVVWLEAIICDDIRFRDEEFAHFQFYLAKTKLIHPASDHPMPGTWMSCDNSHCSDCADDELRSAYSPSDLKISSQTVSVPFGWNFAQTCSMDTIRQIAIPPALALPDSSCFCQSQLMSDRTPPRSLIGSNSDDLPTTQHPKFPALLNPTKKP